MFVTLWEFEVKSGCEVLFEKVYGPEGRWVELFRRDTSYRGTRLLREVGRERLYLTLDEWETREAYLAFRERHAAEYAEIDNNCEGLTLREANLSSWSLPR